MEWEWNVSRVRGGGAHAFPLLSTQERALLYVASRALRISKEPTTHPGTGNCA